MPEDLLRKANTTPQRVGVCWGCDCERLLLFFTLEGYGLCRQCYRGVW